MGDATLIQWTDHTWNPWQGCHKVSAGCKFCYMYRDKERYGQDPRAVVRSSPQTFNAPLRTGKHRWPSGGRVFTCSWSDWFIEEADAWRPDAWAIIRQRPDLTFQILTKRPERISAHLPDDWGMGYPNVWLGVSVEDEGMANARIPLLRQVPAAVRFLSMEPLLGLTHIAGLIAGVPFWVIVGGESGATDKSRDCNATWIRRVIQDCNTAGAPVFVKQLGSRFVDDTFGVVGHAIQRPDGWTRLRDSHGGDPSEWPPGLNVRQFPS